MIQDLKKKKEQEKVVFGSLTDYKQCQLYISTESVRTTCAAVQILQREKNNTGITE